MSIVAGPPGGGKSSFFALSNFADRVFNADDRAAELNGGSFRNIPISVRAKVNAEFEKFVHANIRAGTSFALETTLRSAITFEQSKLARRNGFRVLMVYVALDNIQAHIERVRRRAAKGGHSASESTLRRIYANSLGNLPTALIPRHSGIDFVQIYDNSQPEERPVMVLEVEHGKIVLLADDFPVWLQRALGWTEEDLARHRQS
jgi:predicted ABC-type ATPase